MSVNIKMEYVIQSQPRNNDKQPAKSLFSSSYCMAKFIATPEWPVNNIEYLCTSIVRIQCRVGTEKSSMRSKYAHTAQQNIKSSCRRCFVTVQQYTLYSYVYIHIISTRQPRNQHVYHSPPVTTISNSYAAAPQFRSTYIFENALVVFKRNILRVGLIAKVRFDATHRTQYGFAFETVWFIHTNGERTVTYGLARAFCLHQNWYAAYRFFPLFNILTKENGLRIEET